MRAHKWLNMKKRERETKHKKRRKDAKKREG